MLPTHQTLPMLPWIDLLSNVDRAP